VVHGRIANDDGVDNIGRVGADLYTGPGDKLVQAVDQQRLQARGLVRSSASSITVAQART
jgi:hypothetical protein